MHGWGPWYPLAAVILTAACYLLGRRGLTAGIWVMLGGVEVVSTAAVVSGHDPAGWLVDQLVIILGGLLGALAGAYQRLRHELVAQGWAHAAQARAVARLRERARIAARVHDTLGHDLTLMALAAGGIQVRATDDAVREQAATVRAGAAAAITTLRRLVDDLREKETTGGQSFVDDAVSAFRDAGAMVTVEGEAPGGTGGIGVRLAGRVLRQALTNAVQHSPGEPIAVRVTGNAEGITITCTNPCRRADVATARPGSGLAALSHQLGLYGGRLRTDREQGEFRLTASIPHRSDEHRSDEHRSDEHGFDEHLFDEDCDGDADVTAEYRGRRHRARNALVTAMLAPALALTVLVTAFYVWAGHDAILEPSDYRRLYVGMGADEALTILPVREAPLHGAAPTGEDNCRFHSNGDFPLAGGTFVICFRADRVSALGDHSGDWP